MKKYNDKQMAWATNKILSARNKLLRRFFLFAVGIMLTGFALPAITAENYSMEDVLNDIEIPVGMASVMGAVGNIADPPNEEKVGKQVKAKLWLLSEDQYDDTQAFPSRSGREVGNIPLKAGETWHYIESVIDSPEPKWTAEAGEIASQITNNLTFVIGGMSDATFNLLETGLTKGFFVVWEVCSTGEKFLGGNGCKPLKLMSFDGGATKDNTSTSVVFENQCGHIYSKYVGNMPTLSPETVAADATSIALTDNPRYQLTDGSAAAADITAVTGVSDADVNRVITILGSGGTYPSTISSGGSFLLVNGEQWTANTNSQISFKIFKEGAGTYTFIEVAGTRT